MNHVTHTHASCHTYTGAMSHIHMRHVTHTHASCHTYTGAMSHIHMRHVTHTHTPCHTYDWVTVSCSKNPMKKWGVMQDSCELSNTYKRLMTCHTYKRVMSHIHMRHVTRTNETKKIQMNLVTHTIKSRDTYPRKMRGLLQELPRSKHCNTLQQGGGFCWNRHIQIIWRFSEYVGLFPESVGLFPVPHTHTYSCTL